MASKIIGYVLLAVGVSLVFWTIWQSYNIFTDKTPVPIMFSATANKAASQSGGAYDPRQQIQNAAQEQLKQLLPSDSVAKTLNLLSWSLLAFILIFGGGQIAGAGIKLIALRQ